MVSVDIFRRVREWDPSLGDRFARHLEAKEKAHALVDKLFEELGDLESVTRRLREDYKDDRVLLDTALQYAYSPPPQPR
ncbi:MAG: hypothetical protein GY711_17705 [bacterium]|nr:hypothetical protein [bacterium]